MNQFKKTWMGALVAMLAASVAPVALAQEEATAPAEAAPQVNLEVRSAGSLNELLRNVEQRRVVESREHTEREAQFRRDRDAQGRLLSEARAQRTAAERRSEQLETRFQENETNIGNLQEALSQRLGSLR
jgi:biopolymer transport protein ExbB